MSADQIASRVMTAKEIREAKALDDHLQRHLQPRVKKIVRYLKTRDTRFFNSIIVGVFDALPQWLEFNLEAVGKKQEIPNAHDLATSLGILMFTGSEKMFALDGQHRVAAIKQAQEKFPKQIGTDQYPVIFLAHVDDKEGKVRTRRLFSDINKNAVPVSGGDKVVIDEDDLCAIVTRRVYAEYPLFNGGGEVAVTDKKEQLMQDGRERFTNLLALYTVSKCLRKTFHKRRGTLDNDPENIHKFQQTVSNFFDFVIEHEPSLNRYLRQRATTPQAERAHNRSLFFRPIGLEVLARLYTHFYIRGHLSVLADALRQLPFENPGGIFDGVLWFQGLIQPSAKARNAAVKLCLYLLHELAPADERALRTSLQEVTKNVNYRLPAKSGIRVPPTRA
jgi:DNA sulfur modification protein DndB